MALSAAVVLERGRFDLFGAFDLSAFHNCLISQRSLINKSDMSGRGGKRAGVGRPIGSVDGAGAVLFERWRLSYSSKSHSASARRKRV